MEETGPNAVCSGGCQLNRERQVGSIPSFGRLSNLPVTKIGPQLWEEGSLGALLSPRLASLPGSAEHPLNQGRGVGRDLVVVAYPHPEPRALTPWAFVC